MKQKRIKDDGTFGGPQAEQQLKQGWGIADYDFDTKEFVMYPLSEIETITTAQARALSYVHTNDLSPYERSILGK